MWGVFFVSRTFVLLAFFYFHNKIGKKAAAVAPDADIRYVALFKQSEPFFFLPFLVLCFFIRPFAYCSARYFRSIFSKVGDHIFNY